MELASAQQGALLARTVPECAPAVFTLPAGLGLETRVRGSFPKGAEMTGMTTESPAPPGMSGASGGQGNFTPTRGRARPPHTLGARSAPSSRSLPPPFSPSPSSPLAGGWRLQVRAGPRRGAHNLELPPRRRTPRDELRSPVWGRAAATRGMKLGARGSRSGGAVLPGAALV
jgi:hypothetical protein